MCKEEDQVQGECEICGGKGEYIEEDRLITCHCKKVELEENEADGRQQEND